MSKSGITRRIDELGRIVIPKEMRFNLGIRDGEPLELYIDSNTIVIKKYSQVNTIKELSSKVCKIFEDVLNIDVLISDRDKFIASTKAYEVLINSDLEDKYKLLIDNRESYSSTNKELFGDDNLYITILPIIISTDCSGLVFVLNKNKDNNLNYAKLIQKILAQKLDIS